MPLGYLESSGRGIMITRHFRGSDLADHLRSLHTSGMQEACHSVGAWLCKLHESSDASARSRVLGVADKLDYLATTYGAILRGDRKTWVAYQYLEQTGSRIDARIFPAVRQHGISNALVRRRLSMTWATSRQGVVPRMCARGRSASREMKKQFRQWLRKYRAGTGRIECTFMNRSAPV